MKRMRSVTPVRLAAAAVVAIAAFPLSGCLAGAIPPEPQVNDTPISTPEPPTAEEPTEQDGSLPTTLSFEDGALLPATAHVEWGDGLMADDGWQVTTADDGNGGWAYGTVDDTCAAQFWQGLASDVPTTPGDDRASSDAILGVLLQSDAASVAPHAVDGAFTYQLGGEREVAFRQLTGEQGGHDWIMSARAFTATDAALYVIVDCAGGDANAVLDEVIEKNAILVG